MKLLVVLSFLAALVLLPACPVIGPVLLTAAVVSLVGGIVIGVRGRRLKNGVEPLLEESKAGRIRPRLAVLPDSRGVPSGLGLSFAF